MNTPFKSPVPPIRKSDASKDRRDRTQGKVKPQSEKPDTMEGWLNSRELQPPK